MSVVIGFLAVRYRLGVVVNVAGVSWDSVRSFRTLRIPRDGPTRPRLGATYFPKGQPQSRVVPSSCLHTYLR